MNLTQIVARVKDLTGLYSADMVPNTLIEAWVNEAYNEINRRAEWPWATTPLAPLAGTDSPLFEAQFHPILSYAASVKVLAFVADATERANFYVQEYDRLLGDMLKYYLSGQSLGQYSTAQQLIDFTRDLTTVYDNDIVTDAMLLRWLNDAYLELARRTTWPWTPVTPLGFSGQPAFEEQFRPALSYRVALRVLTLIGDEAGRSEMYTQEYGSLVADMERFYLTSAATGSTVNRDALVRVVRDLTGVYDATLVSDALIVRYLNNAYQELSHRHNWDWLEGTYSVELSDPSVTYANDRYTFTLPDPTPVILDALIVTNNGAVYEMRRVPNMDVVEPDGAKVYYDVSYDGVVSLGPKQPADFTVKIRYLKSSVTLPTGSSVPEFDPQFAMILPYRAAVSVMQQVSPEDNRASAYVEEYTSLYNSMYAMYELSHDDRGFQLGEEGLRTRRYFPWFRPA
jgi:hypothetical protein